MKKGKGKPFPFTLWAGRLLTFLAVAAFITSFFLPAAGNAGSFPGIPPMVDTGWEVFVESVTALNNPPFGFVWFFNPIALIVCLLAPLPNVLMLAAVPGNLLLKRSAVALGAILLLLGGTAFWFCWYYYGYLAIGFYLWIGSIVAMAIASFLVAASYAIEDNIEYDQRLAELKKSCDVFSPP